MSALLVGQTTRRLLLQHLQEARLRSKRLQDSLRAGAKVARANKLDDASAFVNRKVTLISIAPYCSGIMRLLGFEECSSTWKAGMVIAP
jgi:hypothetical protein